MKKVAIQGTLGSYHDIAAHKYFEGEEIQLICCASFEDVFAAVKQDSQTIGMLAIENTIAGSLLHNNELLRQSGTQIVGEYKLRISHSFVCLPDEDWDDITEVNSHPIALMSRHRNKEVNKASIVFTLPHTEGSLSQVLSILSFYRINLTKIQSLPIIGREWEYQFYVDVVFDNVLKYKQSIVAITPLTKELKILGEYEDGKSTI